MAVFKADAAPQDRENSLPAVAICAAIFFLSGFSSLTFQVAWKRILTQEIGVDYAAVTFIVAIFITGLGIGGFLGGIVSREVSGRSPWILALCYAACEILIGLFGFGSEPLLRWIGSASASAGIHGLFPIFSFYLLALLLPTTLMGATLPLMLQVGEKFIPQIGLNIGLLYGINIIGAAFGAIASDFYLLEALGTRSTIDAACVLSLCFPVVFFTLVTLTGRGSHPAADVNRRVTGYPPAMMPLALSAVFGLLTLSLEIVLFRVTAHYLQSDAYAFSIMLFCYLIMMGAGNFVFGAISERASERAVIFLITLGFFVAMVVALNAKEIISAIYPESSIVNPALFGPRQFDIDKITSVMVIMLPVFFASGLFPLMIRMLCRDERDIGMATGRVYLAFSIGNGVGVLATGLLIVPTLGTIDTCRLLIAIAACSSIALALYRKAAPIFPLAAIGIAGVIGAAFLPGDYFLTFNSVVEGTDIGFPYRIIEGKTGALSLFEKEHAFELNGTKYTGGAIFNAWADIGYAPTMMVGHPIKRALVIGAGHGDQAMALDSLPEHPIVDVAEISDELIEAQRDDTVASKIGAAYFRGNYGIRVHVIDGRRWVNEAFAQGIKYDVIQLGITMPQSGTSGNLYTREMFRKLYDILADDGVLMVYSFASALRTGLAVFPHAYFLDGVPGVLAFTGEVFMTKRAIEHPVWDDAALAATAALCDLRGREVRNNHMCPIAVAPNSALSLSEITARFVEPFPLNTDDNVIMTFNKLWKARQHGPIFPETRLLLTDDFVRAAAPSPIAVTRTR